MVRLEPPRQFGSRQGRGPSPETVAGLSRPSWTSLRRHYPALRVQPAPRFSPTQSLVRAGAAPAYRTPLLANAVDRLSGLSRQKLPSLPSPPLRTSSQRGALVFCRFVGLILLMRNLPRLESPAKINRPTFAQFRRPTARCAPTHRPFRHSSSARARPSPSRPLPHAASSPRIRPA